MSPRQKRYETFEFCHFEERQRREILMLVQSSRFLPSVEMTNLSVFQSSPGTRWGQRCGRPVGLSHLRPWSCGGDTRNRSPERGCLRWELWKSHFFVIPAKAGIY